MTRSTSLRATPWRPMIEQLEHRYLLAAFDVLVFSRTAAFRHDSIAAGTTAIQQLGAANNFSVTATEDPTAFTDANLAQYEAVVFLLTTGDVLNDTQQGAFERYIAAGHGYVGIHSASDTEYTWPFYGGLVGAYFSSHPAIQQATVKVADRVFPGMAGLPQRWVRTDEWYNFQTNPRGNVHVLATLDETTYAPGTGAMGFDHPISWTQQYGGGRSFYTGMGHTIASYSETLFRQHILGGILYAAGAAQGDAGATENVNYQKTVLDDNTLDPMQLDVASDGRVFYVERGGAVKVWSPATNSTTTLATIPVELNFENGGLGIALDPNFATNQWLYLFYSAAPFSADEQHLSRFTVVGDHLDLASEKILLHIPTQRRECCHSAGSLDFGPDGTLYIATGDNTNPFASDGYAPIDEQPGRSDWDAQKSSANTNDLRGKILRIKPEADGTYSIPAGNLFPSDATHRPEIYVMGDRNPFRISVDQETGWLYWGEVGPDANVDSSTRGPMGHDEFNQAKAPGNYGWPYFVADNKPYDDYDFATGISGPLFNPAAPINNSPNNTGGQNLPPAKPAWIWYPYGTSTLFPELGSGGRTAMAGPVYHYNAATTAPNGLPSYYDDTLFIYEWSRGWIKEVKIDANGNVLKINPFLPNMTFLRPMDMKIGPDGVMYLIEWGTDFGGNNTDSQIVRIDYVEPRLFAASNLQAQAVSGRSVQLSWGDNSLYEAGYKIERRALGGAFNQIATVGADATSSRDDTASPGTSYEYRIRSFAALDNSAFSNSASVKTWITGDLNGDGSVSIADFITLASNFNSPGDWAKGDLNADGLVTIADFIDLSANFGSTQTIPGKTFYTGVNLAGAEFGATPTPGNLGTYGSSYTYPTAAEVDYYIAKGMDTFRLPFRWERLQPTLNAPLDSSEFARLNNFVSYATSKGAHVALEPHNFARYYPDPANFQSSTQGLIGSAAVPNSAFADLWSRLADNYKSNPNVIFNLMNEPNTMPTQQWVSASNTAISAIRATGANNLILVPGNGWTGAWTWSATWYGTPNATAMLNIVDPANNFAFDVHQYLDSDGSGTSSAIFNNDPTIGVQRLTAFTNWLKANNRRGFLGEFAVANSTIGADPSQIGDETLINMLQYVGANNDVWLGWTWWSGGPWWGNYMFNLDPLNLGAPNQTDRAAMAVLQGYFTPIPQSAALGIAANYGATATPTPQAPATTDTRKKPKLRHHRASVVTPKPQKVYAAAQSRWMLPQDRRD